MEDNLKWKLATGRYVEDILFGYGLTRQYEDQCHSFIIDLGDKNLMAKFTKEEAREIEMLNAHPLPPVPERLLNYLNEFTELTTIEALEKRTRQQTFDFFTEFDLDWAQHAMQETIRLFHAKYFPITDQTEADIIRRICPFIDKAFDNVALDIRTGEMESSASSERKNADRQPHQRKRHGHRTAFLLKWGPAELGCAEVGKKDAGDRGSKEVRELGLKVPKMLKDQIYKLVRTYPDRRTRLVNIGFVNMGLKLRALVLDNPSTYVCRLFKTDAYYFPTTPETVGSDFGALIAIVSQVKQLACATLAVTNERKRIRSAVYQTAANDSIIPPPCPASPVKKPRTL